MSKFLSDNSLRRLYRLVPWSPVQKIMAIYDTMDRRSKEIIAEKKATLAKGGDLVLDVVEGKDLMSILRMYLVSLDLVLLTSPCIRQ